MGHRCVMVIRRGDHHRIEIVAVNHVTKVGEVFGGESLCLDDARRGGCQHVGIDVAEHHNVGVAAGGEPRGEFESPAAGADHRDGGSLVG